MPVCQLPADTATHSSHGSAGPCVPTVCRCCSASVTRGPRSWPFSPESCTSPTFAPFNPQAHPALPAPPGPHQSGAGAWLSRGGRGPGRSPLQSPLAANVLGGPKTALWRMDRGCLPPGRFISSFFKPCSDFSLSPLPLPAHASLPSPSNLSAQPGERATGLQGD